MKKEYESKFLCSEKVFHELWDTYANKEIEGKSTVEQVNYYFDTKDKNYFKHKVTIRIRQKNDTYTLTMKDKKKYTNKNFLSKEYSILLDPDQFNNIKISGVVKLSQYSGLPFEEGYGNVNLLGSIKTEREILLLNNTKVCFDKSYYGNGVYDFEIEIEGDESNIKLTETDILKHDISRNVIGKYERFVHYTLGEENIENK